MKWPRGPSSGPIVELLSPEKTFLVIPEELHKMQGGTSRGTWPPKVRKRRDQHPHQEDLASSPMQDPREPIKRPSTASLEGPQILDPELMAELDMTLLSKETLGAFLLTRVAKSEPQTPKPQQLRVRWDGNNNSSSSSSLIAKAQQPGKVGSTRAVLGSSHSLGGSISGAAKSSTKSLDNQNNNSTNNNNDNGNGNLEARRQLTLQVDSNRTNNVLNSNRKISGNNHNNGNFLKSPATTESTPSSSTTSPSISSKSPSCGRKTHHSEPRSEIPVMTRRLTASLRVLERNVKKSPRPAPTPNDRTPTSQTSLPAFPSNAILSNAGKTQGLDSNRNPSKPVLQQTVSDSETEKSSGIPKKRPKSVTCYVCGREFGTLSFPIHEPKCLQKWDRENKALPKNLRRIAPQRPDFPIDHEDWNTAAWEQSQSLLAPCAKCKRTFLPERLAIHERSCKADKKLPSTELNSPNNKKTTSKSSRAIIRISPPSITLDSIDNATESSAESSSSLSLLSNVSSTHQQQQQQLKKSARTVGSIKDRSRTSANNVLMQVAERRSYNLQRQRNA